MLKCLLSIKPQSSMQVLQRSRGIPMQKTAGLGSLKTGSGNGGSRLTKLLFFVVSRFNSASSTQLYPSPFSSYPFLSFRSSPFPLFFYLSQQTTPPQHMSTFSFFSFSYKHLPSPILPRTCSFLILSVHFIPSVFLHSLYSFPILL